MARCLPRRELCDEVNPASFHRSPALPQATHHISLAMCDGRLSAPFARPGPSDRLRLRRVMYDCTMKRQTCKTASTIEALPGESDYYHATNVSKRSSPGYKVWTARRFYSYFITLRVQYD